MHDSWRTKYDLTNDGDGTTVVGEMQQDLGTGFGNGHVHHIRQEGKRR